MHGVNEGYGDRAVWRIAGPMIISAISTPLLGMVDTAVMGHLDDAWYLGAVAAGATIFSVLYMSLNFLRMGTTGITAQAHGAGDAAAMRESLAQPMVIALFMAALLLMMQAPIIDFAIALLEPSTEVAAYTREYFVWRIWSAPASLSNFVIAGWLLGMQNARGPLAMMLTMNLTNIVLDLLFVLVFGMTVDGVAIASVLTEYLGIVVGLYFVTNELKYFQGQWNLNELLNPDRYRQIFAVNSNLLLRTLALMFTFAFITARGARMGDLILAANALLINFQYFLAYALDGIAHAAEALVGKAIGARSRRGLEQVVSRTLRWSVIFSVGFTVVYWIAGPSIINMLTSIPDVRSTALVYLPWIIISPLISVWSFLYDGVYVGATRTREMRIVMVASMLFVFLPVWYLFQDMGNNALWLAFTAFMGVRGIAMHVWYRHLIKANTLVKVARSTDDD